MFHHGCCDAAIHGISKLLLQGNQFVGSGAETDLLGVLERLLPAHVWIAVQEVVVIVVPVRLRKVVAELTVADRRRLQACVNASLVERDRIEGGKHSDVRKNRSVILRVAVAVRRYIGDQADVEGRAAITDCL